MDPPSSGSNHREKQEDEDLKFLPSKWLQWVLKPKDLKTACNGKPQIHLVGHRDGPVERNITDPTVTSSERKGPHVPHPDPSWLIPLISQQSLLQTGGWEHCLR